MHHRELRVHGRKSLVACALAFVVACVVLLLASCGDELVREKGVVRSKFPLVRQLQTAELASWMDAEPRHKPILLDVRTQAEFDVSRLPGARRVEPDAKPATVKVTLDPGNPNRPVVLYCSVGFRSSALAEKLMKDGMTNVFNLEGSIFAWANEGRPLERDGQPTSKVHPYNKTFGKMLLPNYRADVPPVQD